MTEPLSATLISTPPGCGTTADRPAQVAVLRLTGALILAEVPMLRSAVHALLGGRSVTLVIDVTGLVAADEMGLAILPELTDTARQAGVRLILAAPSPELRERLHQLGATHLEISETVIEP